MSLNTEVLQRITTPKPHRKGSTEESIYAENQRVKTTAALVACVVRKSADAGVQRSIDIIAGRAQA